MCKKKKKKKCRVLAKCLLNKHWLQLVHVPICHFPIAVNWQKKGLTARKQKNKDICDVIYDSGSSVWLGNLLGVTACFNKNINIWLQSIDITSQEEEIWYIAQSIYFVPLLVETLQSGVPD